MFRIYCRNLATRAPYANSHRRDTAFGTLNPVNSKVLATHISENYIPDDPDGYDKEEYDLGPRKNLYHYKYEITKLANQGPAGLQRALQSFEELKSQSKLKPHYKHFVILIKACAKAGYTQRAFELYDEFLRYNKKPPHGIVTSLINSCSECPFPDYGLAKLKWLQENLRIDHNFQFNIIHYNAMIKAYGRLNDHSRIQEVIEEMFKFGIYPNRDTFNMLIIACASNRGSGTITALSIFKQMKYHDLMPNDTTYRTLIRCIRDCDLGSKKLIKDTFAKLPTLTTIPERIRLKKLKNNGKTQSEFVWMPNINTMKNNLISCLAGLSSSGDVNLPKNGDADLLRIDHHNDEQSSSLISFGTKNTQLMKTDTQSGSWLMEFDDDHNKSNLRLPNLISDDHLEIFSRIDSIDLNKTKKPNQRLMLFGGMHGFLEKMVEDGVKPCNRTFGLILGCIRSTKHECMEYYRLALDYKIYKDIPFYDSLIKHAANNYYWHDRLDFARFLLNRMQLETELAPNITTYEAVAKCCDNIDDAKRLIDDLELCGFTISNRLIRYLYECPIFRKDFKYLNELVKICHERKYKPKKELIDLLENLKVDYHDIILRYEQDILNPKDKPRSFDESQIQAYDQFGHNMDKWLKEVHIQDEDHPWEQFHVERKSKRQGFVEFVEKFNALKEAKEKHLTSGEKRFGNLMEEANKILETKRKEAKKIIPSEDRILKQID